MEPDERARQTSALAADLACALEAYGFDCRGIGLLAPASELVDKGWTTSPPAKIDARLRPRRGEAARVTVAAFCLAAEIEPRALSFDEPGYPPMRYNPLRIDIIRALYADGTPVYEIAELVHRSQRWVYNVLKDRRRA